MSEWKPAMPANVRSIRGEPTPPTREWDCGTCMGTGVALVKRTDLPMAAPFAYRCTCWRGRNDKRSYPILGASVGTTERIDGPLLRPLEES